MGDHWMGEKDLFHDCSARVPLIVYDPRESADCTRGTESNHLVQGIDLAPTFLEYFGGKSVPHIMEGMSLGPLLANQDVPWREYCVSEYDYATRDARKTLAIDQNDARLVMVFDGRWKYIHVETMRPMLFDLKTDPNELTDLASDEKHRDQLEHMRSLHFEWTREHHNRTTLTAAQINQMAADKEPPGIIIAYTNKEEFEKDGFTLPSHVVR